MIIIVIGLAKIWRELSLKLYLSLILLK